MDKRDVKASAMSSILMDLMAKGKTTDEAEKVELLKKFIEMPNMPTFAHLLPIAFNLNGYPYTLDDHFYFETVFQTHMARTLLLMTARQVAKSTSMASRSIFLSTTIPNFSILFITPLYEQIRRFSTNYVRPFIETSPFKDFWIGTNTENSVLQRSFKNFSKMYFSFALLDADRVRGISAHACMFDEVQDIDQNLIPIIQETISASPWRLVMYTGTPKSLDNTIEGKWQASSQAEWCIPCHQPGCDKLNIPVAGLDLEKMIGPWHDGIGCLEPKVGRYGKLTAKKGVPAVICAKCGRWINPRAGHWIHKEPKKIAKFPGYHVPQIIAPIHYEDQERWSELLGKQQGLGNMTTARFYNEVLGVSYDVGSKLITETELRSAACLPWENNPLEPTIPIHKRREYVMRVMGVDWGGGGEEEISFTCMAVLGLRGDGKIDVLYGRRLLTPHQPLQEAKEILRMVTAFECQFVAHDYNGAGSMREVFMVQAGLPVNKLIPFVYIRSAMRNYVDYHKSESKHSRDFWTLDKARSLGTTCEALKLKWLRTFKYDKKSEEDRGLLHDFLSLLENKVEMARGPDVYMIQRNPAYPDDFAHAVNYGASAIWHSTNSWPNFAHIAGLQLSVEQFDNVNPDKPWTDGNYMDKP